MRQYNFASGSIDIERLVRQYVEFLSHMDAVVAAREAIAHSYWS